jgi:hypothetical protein
MEDGNIFSVGVPVLDDSEPEEPRPVYYNPKDALALWDRSPLKGEYVHLGHVPLGVGGWVYQPRTNTISHEEKGHPGPDGGPVGPPVANFSLVATCSSSAPAEDDSDAESTFSELFPVRPPVVFAHPKWDRGASKSLPSYLRSCKLLCAAAAGLKARKTQVTEWIWDTGAAVDTVPKAALVGLDQYCTKPDVPNIISTANGNRAVEEEILLRLPTLGEVCRPLVLDGPLSSTPAILCVGWRCMELGYDFHWPPCGKPVITLPGGKQVFLAVENFVPILESKAYTCGPKAVERSAKAQFMFAAARASGSGGPGPPDVPATHGGSGKAGGVPTRPFRRG